MTTETTEDTGTLFGCHIDLLLDRLERDEVMLRALHASLGRSAGHQLGGALMSLSIARQEAAEFAASDKATVPAVVRRVEKIVDALHECDRALFRGYRVLAAGARQGAARA